MSKRTDQEYIGFAPYDDECQIKCRKVKVVTTKTPHRCFGFKMGEFGVEYSDHEIPPGTRARFESALVEGVWGKYYTCLGCIDLYLDDWEKKTQ